MRVSVGGVRSPSSPASPATPSSPATSAKPDAGAGDGDTSAGSLSDLFARLARGDTSPPPSRPADPVDRPSDDGPATPDVPDVPDTATKPAPVEETKGPAPFSEAASSRGGKRTAMIRRVESGNARSDAEIDEYEEYMATRGNARRERSADRDQGADWAREAASLPATMTQREADAYADRRGFDGGQMRQLNKARRELGMAPVGREPATVRPAGDGRTVMRTVEEARSGPARNKVLAGLEPADLDDIAEYMARYNRESPRGDPYRNRKQASAYDKRERVIRDVLAEKERRLR